MGKAPDKIYIGNYNESISHGTFSTEREEYSHIEFIRKDALLEWANEYKKAIEVNGDENDAYTRGEYSVINSLIDKINSL